METTFEIPTRRILVEPEIFINEYGREFVRYVWYDAEIAVINNTLQNNDKI